MNNPEYPYHGKGTFFGMLKSIFVNQGKRERDYEHNLRLKEIRERTAKNRAVTKSIYQRRFEEMGYSKKGED